MEQKYIWATEDIYKTDSDWQKEYEDIKTKLNLLEFKGKLGDKSAFLSLMKKEESITRVLEKLSVYAMMKHDADTRDSVYDAMVNQITSTYAEFSSLSEPDSPAFPPSPPSECERTKGSSV